MAETPPDPLERALAAAQRWRSAGRLETRDALLARHADIRTWLEPLLDAETTRAETQPAAKRAGGDAAPLERVRELAPTDRYRIGAEIARGGMGAILEAFDQDLRRDLAMKVLLGDLPATDEPTSGDVARLVDRFLEEAQVTGQLDHPGVVPVHELGMAPDGRVFFTMRLVRGEDLGAVFEKVRAGADEWTLTRALGVLSKVCDTLAYAHDKGVVHRDLKPQNVMVGQLRRDVRHGLGPGAKIRSAMREGSRDVRPSAAGKPRRDCASSAGRRDSKAVGRC